MDIELEYRAPPIHPNSTCPTVMSDARYHPLIGGNPFCKTPWARRKWITCTDYVFLELVHIKRMSGYLPVFWYGQGGRGGCDSLRRNTLLAGAGGRFRRGGEYLGGISHTDFRREGISPSARNQGPPPCCSALAVALTVVVVVA